MVIILWFTIDPHMHPRNSSSVCANPNWFIPFVRIQACLYFITQFGPKFIHLLLWAIADEGREMSVTTLMLLPILAQLCRRNQCCIATKVLKGGERLSIFP